MKNWFFFLGECFLLTSILVAAEKANFTGFQVLEINHLLEEDQIKFLSWVVDFWTSPRQNGSEVTFMLPLKYRGKVKEFLNKEGISYKIVMKDLQSEIDKETKENREGCNKLVEFSQNRRLKRESIWEILSNALTRRGRKITNSDLSLNEQNYIEPLKPQLKEIDGGEMNWNQYHRLKTIYNWMEDLAHEYSDLVTILVLGTTAEGRNIVALKIGQNSKHSKPGIFIEGGIHAREWISVASVSYVANELVKNPSNADLLEIFDFFILPVLNPDGYEYTHTDNRMWRKNRSKDSSLLNILTNCIGVDLNRNFGFSWGDIGLMDAPQMGTPLPCLETYIGSAPFSEQETQAVRDFILSQPGKFISYLAIHSYGSKIVYPWSSTEEKVADWQELKEMANRFAEPVFLASGGTDLYKIGTATEIQYRATGGADDWARGGAGIKFVYLVELPGKGRGFLLPPSWILHVSRTTLAGVQGLARAIAQSL
ncbi:carboxypeptidase B [Eurytemora carolleeae]|uniref:carboxypeptidase B n=1 Tax=Eurytemora carolleeae TaxID=1294199 RepID=UPI000C759410|nr:carboxypeptidase B [Eurytemora carolleeae]|eukprot:XP_023344616.1 carboxypeptidase B-like [Eurytemora affinis]